MGRWQVIRSCHPFTSLAAAVFGAVFAVGTINLARSPTIQQKSPPSSQPSGREPAANQPAPTGTGLIAGAVVATDSGRPIRRARVSISGGDPRIARTMTTDDRGNFSFSALPAGEFILSGAKPGSLDSTYGQKRPGSGRAGTPIQLANGQHLDHLTLQISRGGVITGTILDEAGYPAYATTVRSMRYVLRTGERLLQPAGRAQTDDRGIYRITGLLPGDYIVSATPRESDNPQAEEKMNMELVAAEKMRSIAMVGGNVAQATQDIQKMLDQMTTPSPDPSKDPPSGYAPVYYPGTTIGTSASTIALDISEEKAGVDVQLQIVPMTRVTGVVTTTDGGVPPGTQILLLDVQAVPGLAARTRRPGSDGRFAFAGVPPGQYTLIARANGGAMVTTATSAPGGQGLMVTNNGLGPLVTKLEAMGPSYQYWAMADIMTDNRGAPPVTLNLQPGMSVSGNLVFEGAPAPADLSRVRLALTPVGQGPVAELAGGIRPAGVDADGHFVLLGVVPGRYRLALASSAGLAGWSLKSAVVGGQDTLDFPFEMKPNQNVNGATVSLTMRASSVSGVLQGPDGQPAANYTVVVFSSESRYWTPQSRRIQAARPATDGRFSFRDLPPGEYRLAAIGDVEPGQWFDPLFLRQLTAASMPVSIGEGERKTQDLRLSGR
jgi:hypothetical protein